MHKSKVSVLSCSFSVVNWRRVKALAYSPDGGKLAAVSSDGLLRVIDTSEER